MEKAEVRKAVVAQLTVQYTGTWDATKMSESAWRLKAIAEAGKVMTAQVAEREERRRKAIPDELGMNLLTLEHLFEELADKSSDLARFLEDICHEEISEDSHTA